VSLEQRVRRLEDRERIKELRAKYCLYFDQRNTDAFVELFTADGTLAVTKGTFRGREEIGSLLDELGEMPNRWESHMSHNPIIDIDGDSATGRWYYEVPVVWEDGTAGWSQGTYDEEYRRVDGEWRFSLVEIDSNYRVDYAEGWAGEIRQ
jgi:hypothetical protein